MSAPGFYAHKFLWPVDWKVIRAVENYHPKVEADIAGAVFVKCLQHNDPIVRHTAVGALGRTGNAAHMDVISRIEHDDAEQIVRRAATTALARLRKHEGG